MKAGHFRSSRLRDFYYEPETEALYAETLNSKCALKKLPQKWGEIYADRSIALPDWYPVFLGAIVTLVIIEVIAVAVSNVVSVIVVIVCHDFSSFNFGFLFGMRLL
ncbi:MAG: hypothetical protein FWG90_11565 [Oscillospiraceae bacterium]|nr:hypothetical protein [Oscillospiraceae bacterium]